MRRRLSDAWDCDGGIGNYLARNAASICLVVAFCLWILCLTYGLCDGDGHGGGYDYPSNEGRSPATN